MRRIVLIVISVLAPLASVASPFASSGHAGAASGQQPATVTTVFEKRFEAATPAAPFEIVQRVLEFAPGAGSPLHTHGGQTFITVLEGQITLRRGGTDTTFKAGDAWVENPGEEDEPFNDGTARVRTLVTTLLPQGAQITTPLQDPRRPASTMVYVSRTAVTDPPAQLDVVQRLTEIAPGASVPAHTHPGPNVATALEGDLTLNIAGTAPQGFKTGDNWVEPANVAHGVTNIGSTTVRIVTSTLVPKGAPVSALAQQVPGAQPAPVAAQPGSAAPGRPVASAPAQVPGQLPRTGGLSLPQISTMLVGFALLAGGLAFRRGRRG